MKQKLYVILRTTQLLFLPGLTLFAQNHSVDISTKFGPIRPINFKEKKLKCKKLMDEYYNRQTKNDDNTSPLGKCVSDCCLTSEEFFSCIMNKLHFC